MSAERVDTLRLSLDCDRRTTPARGAAICVVAITNAAPVPQLINKRFVVGYEKTMCCDLYFEVMKEGSIYVGTDEYAASSKPKALSAEYYQLVEPGEALTARIPLDKYYRFPPGTYQIRAVYAPQPDEEAGREAWSGAVRSNEIVLQVQ